MKPNIGRACFGGLVATAVITFMVYFVSPSMTGGPSDLAGMLVGLLGVSWIVAIAMHVVIGTLIFPTLYAVYLNHRLPGGPAKRGLTWGVMLWLLSQAVIIPATGGGIFSSAEGGLPMVLESLAGHLVYGLVFGVWVGDSPVERPARVHRYHSEPHARRAG